MIIGYSITTALSVTFFILYKKLVKFREFWLSLLFACITVVNVGYLMLSLAKSVAFAIFANDVAYFGSVFLSMCMLFTILKLCGFTLNKPLVISLLSLGVVMFFIVATSGFLPWYYKSVSLQTVNGVTKLVKDYGVLHNAYLVYLVMYFVAMIVTILYSIIKKKGDTQKIAGLLAFIVFVNLAVWFVEKFTPSRFEYLSVSYLASEVLFIFLYCIMDDFLQSPSKTSVNTCDAENEIDKKVNIVLLRLKNGETLAKRELEILKLILQNKKRKDIADELYLSENTIKTHTRSLYNKINVFSRKELLSIFDDDND